MEVFECKCPRCALPKQYLAMIPPSTKLYPWHSAVMGTAKPRFVHWNARLRSVICYPTLCIVLGDIR